VMSVRILILAVVMTTGFARAQEFAIKKIELKSQGVLLHYDLVDTSRATEFTVMVYSSLDNFTAPLRWVTGDVGSEVKPGLDRNIMWDSKKELGQDFHGEITLEIRGNPYKPFVRLDGFGNDRVIKRGTPLVLRWTGGPAQGDLNFALYKGDQLAIIVPNVSNLGAYDLMVPAHLKPGTDYHLVISDSRNKDLMTKTPLFEIRRKIPLGFKVAAGTVTAVILTAVFANLGPDYIEGPPPLPGSN
jgi:hypothetical protein